MMHKRWLFLALSLSVLVSALILPAADPATDGQREAAQKAFEAGNFKDACDGFHAIALNPQDDPLKVGDDLAKGILCLQRLARSDEIDDFREGVIKVHGKNWRLLKDAARSYLGGEQYGVIIAGKFYRGNNGRKGNARWVNTSERDRVRAMQLLEQALPLAAEEKDKAAASQVYIQYANTILHSASGAQAWRLNALTDLKVLPDYGDQYGGRRYGRGYGGGGSQGAPVDAEGNPIYHKVPESYEAAQTDGERMRWLLAQAVKVDAGRQAEALSIYANFLQGLYGVQTLAYYGSSFKPDDAVEKEAGIYSLQTLTDEETICQLATGIKRFKLPDEHNPIKLFHAVAALGKTLHGEQALNQLAQIYSDRRQYPRSAEMWKKSIADYGPGANNYKQAALDQIVKNWGQFETTFVQPAGSGATIGYRFRNGKKVEFTAHAIKVEKLLEDVKAYLKANPGQIDWNKTQLGNIGYRIVQQNEAAYVGEQVAKWSLDLEPRANHFDRRVTVTTPLQKAGAYLLVGQMADGNVSRIVVWLSDTVIVKKQLEGKAYYFVADAVSGTPIEKANIEFFGWQQERIDKTNNFKITTANFAEFTDADGQVFPNPQQMPQGFQWLATARTKESRFAFLGFSNVWYQARHDPEHNQPKVYAITDRPVYRPSQTVKFKLWVRKTQYDQPDKSDYAEAEFNVQVSNPKGEVAQKKTYKCDAFGGLEGEFAIVKDATLGMYYIQIVDSKEVGGGGSFRVEEYKKPEFQVTVDAPTEPVALGEKITATITAKYYFGAPVVNAKVKYKVMRTSYTERWHPVARWDWYYGRGYWWFAYDYAWYPGWHEWGCKRPYTSWWPRPQLPPEMVAEQEVAVGADGTVKVEIDTGVAKELHGDQDHQYTVTAEVTDDSRRTIVGEGKVLVAREPFKVFAWVDRGHYQVGDAIQASFSAHTLDQKPVKGKGVLVLYRITYDDAGEPNEAEVGKWNVDTNEEGHAHQQIKAADPGQYRLSYKLTDAKKHTQEGGYIFVIRGEGFTGREFHFNDLELITDKKEYAAGDTVKLMINTDRANGTVVLFVRPTNGVYLPPKVIRLKGKSTVEEIAVVKRDMPNFFIEAFTISGGKYYTETREVVVPPESRMLDVAVSPSQKEYKPGAAAKIGIKLTDADGKPFVGTTVVTIYDKAVEYISGGSNVGDIKEFFWKWRRHHYPQHEHNLALNFWNLLKQGEVGMAFLGTFGASVADERAAFAGRGAEYRRDRNGVESEEQSLRKNMADAMPAAKAGGLAESKRELQSDKAKQVDGQQPPAEAVEPSIRKNFADTALWVGALTTNKEGLAEVELTMPEQLTGWKIRTWGLGHGTKVGEGSAEVTTSKNLLVRLQAPRFFIEKDEVVLSANVHNYLKVEKKVQVVLELDGTSLTPMASPIQNVTIGAGEEKRVDWRVKVAQEGTAVIRMKALTDEESDAMQMQFPVFVHGILKTESFSGAIRPNETAGSVTFRVPAERRINESRLEVRYSPTLAGAMVDALPYLVDSPYNTTEGTIARFLPTVLTQNILLRMKLDLKAIQEKRTNLNAQEIGDDAERAKQWKRYDRNPVFDAAEVQNLVKQNVQAITEMQLSDGGWGWFSGYGEHASPHTTALVVHGLQVAAANDVAIVPNVLERGVEWLKRYQTEQVQMLKNAPTMTKPWKTQADNLDAFVYMVLIDADAANNDMLEFLYRDRTKLSVYAMAMYGLALHKQAQAEKLAMILKNISQYVVQDAENQTAYLKLPNEAWWWYWYGSDIEANAYYLKLLSKTDPQSPVASGLVKYLLNNRKHATYWNSTRDTAICIEAMAEYMQASGEDKPDMTLEVWLDGKKQKEVKINAENLFSFDNKFVLTGDAVENGMHKLELKKQGTGPVYFNAYLTNFSLEDFITKAGLEIKVQRKFYKLVRDPKSVKVSGSRGQAVDQKVEKYLRQEIENLGELKSGELVEIELEIDSKNDYEYLMFEDLKAAGFEPVEVRSGYNGNDLGAYVEFRDERVTFFARTLSRGKHSVAYRLRAEIPGKFSALPAKGSGFYAPELKANSDEMKISIVD